MCQVVDLAEFKAARALRRLGNRGDLPADAEMAEQQLPLLADTSADARFPDRPARVRQVPHRQRMLAHLESMSAGSATQPL